MGATLKAAVEYTKESEIHSEFSQQLLTLLDKMQDENPKERPDIEVRTLLSDNQGTLSYDVD